jgi:hypothetical protein
VLEILKSEREKEEPKESDSAYPNSDQSGEDEEILPG